MTQRRPGQLLAALQANGLARLAAQDGELFGMLERETRRQSDVLMMVAASSIADPSVLICEGSALTNVTTEGYPGRRYHAGCAVVDEVERLAIKRARQLFGARYANVQPHSGSSANGIVMFTLLDPGDTILGMDLNAGGHLTHGSKASVMGHYFKAIPYGVGEDGLIDYQAVAQLAHQHRPKLIICGASAYPRTIDFARFRAIADEVDAYLLADISHIAGLVVAGLHPSPIDHAHFTTTSTYKQLYGPRGGLVLIGNDHDAPAPDGKMTLRQLVQRGCFPYCQGTPNLAAVAAKAAALQRCAQPAFVQLMRRVIDGAALLADWFEERGYRVLTAGTDNHMVLMNVLERGTSGVIAERALEECNIIVNKNRIPGDNKSALVTSGIRLGSNSLALRGMDDEALRQCAELVHHVIERVESAGDRDYHLPPAVVTRVRESVAMLCRRFPIPHYPVEPHPLSC